VSLVLFADLFLSLMTSILIASSIVSVVSKILDVPRVYMKRFAQAILLILLIYLFVVFYESHSYIVSQSYSYFVSPDVVSLLILLSVLLSAFFVVSAYPVDLEMFEIVVAVSLLGVLGSVLIAHALDPLSIIVSWALLSLSSYSIIALMKDRYSLDASARYIIVGVLASQLLLFGLGIIVSTSVASRSFYTTDLHMLNTALVLGLSMFFVAIGFKLGSAPLHFWLPDVYGRASPYAIAAVSGFIKIGLIALLVRIVSLYSGYSPVFYIMIFLSVLSMFIGSFTPLTQRDVQRILAYSSIAQIGYILIGVSIISLVASPGTSGFQKIFYIALGGVVVHALGYSISKASLFSMLGYVRRVSGSSDLSSLRDIEKPWQMKFSIIIHLANLIGVPPLPGFWGKLLLFLSATYNDPRLYLGGIPWLAILGVLASVVSVFYYLNIMRASYFESSKSSLEKKLERSGGSLSSDIYYPYIASILIMIIGLLIPLILVYIRILT